MGIIELTAENVKCSLNTPVVKLLIHPLDPELIDIICSELMTVQKDHYSSQKPKWWEESTCLGYSSVLAMEKIPVAIMH